MASALQLNHSYFPTFSHITVHSLCAIGQSACYTLADPTQHLGNKVRWSWLKDLHGRKLAHVITINLTVVSAFRSYRVRREGTRCEISDTRKVPLPAKTSLSRHPGCQLTEIAICSLCTSTRRDGSTTWLATMEPIDKAFSCTDEHIRVRHNTIRQMSVTVFVY